MIFIRYFLGRFLLYLGALSLVGGFLFSCIEFFERVTRFAHVPFSIVISFVGIHFIPLIINYMPLFIWLTSCLVIRELLLHDYFTVLALVGMRIWYLARCFLMVGCCVGLALFVVKEVMMGPLYMKVIEYKQKHFKGISFSTTVSIDGWFLLDDNQWCYVRGIDQQTGQLEGVILVSDTETLCNRIMYSRAAQVTDEQMMLSDEARIFDPALGRATSGQQVKVFVGGLQKNLMLKSGHLSFIGLMKHIRVHGFASPLVVREWGQRLLWYLFIMLYPLVLFLLFSAAFMSEPVRWISMFAWYPIATFIQTAVCALLF